MQIGFGVNRETNAVRIAHLHSENAFMIRGALSIFAGLSGLVFIFIAALSWLSGTDIRWDSQVGETSGATAVQLREWLEIFVDQGRLAISLSQWVFHADPNAREFYGADHSGWRIRLGRRLPHSRLVGSLWDEHGFMYDAVAYPAMKGATMTLPVWLVLLGTGATPGCLLVASAFVRWRASRRRGMCRVCGYDLRASPEQCPECGTAVRVPQSERSAFPRNTRIRRLAWNVTCAVSFMAGAMLALIVLGRVQPPPFRFTLLGTHLEARLQDGRLCLNDSPQNEDAYRQQKERAMREEASLDAQVTQLAEAQATYRELYYTFIETMPFLDASEQEAAKWKLNQSGNACRWLRKQLAVSGEKTTEDLKRAAEAAMDPPMESCSGGLWFPIGLCLVLPAIWVGRRHSL